MNPHDVAEPIAPSPAALARDVEDLEDRAIEDDAVADLGLAGIPYEDEGGRYVDFHSLRVSLSTLLAAHKVSPRAAQAIMRHTDPRLTARVYTDEKLLPLAAELVNVPAISAGQRASGPAEPQANLNAIVASLSAGERQALVGMLNRSQVG